MAIAKGRTSASNSTPTLEVGARAPDFTLKRHNSDDVWTLSDLRGNKNVVLAFYPFAFTGV